jgi:hypothetical protein
LPKKKGSYLAVFRELRRKLCAENSSGGRPSIQQKNCLSKNSSISGINLLLWVIEVRKKKGCYLAVLRELRRNLCA